jgi:acetoacetate decarboxylase
MYLNDYMRMGKEASSTQVTKLQVFLNAVGITAPLTGVFDAATDAAVRSFQMKHKAEVLTPWYMAKIVPHENPTGWVYQLTRWKINNIVCPGSEAYPVLN